MEAIEELPEEARERFVKNLPYGYREGEKITGTALRQCGLVVPDPLKEYQAWQIHLVEVP